MPDERVSCGERPPIAPATTPRTHPHRTPARVRAPRARVRACQSTLHSVAERPRVLCTYYIIMNIMNHFLIDTGTVIDLVQRRPCIWNTSDPDYKDKQMRTRVWEEICDEMFEDLSPQEKDMLVKNIQQRWRTARDTYIKYKGSRESRYAASGKRTAIVKNYAFAERLQFLDRLYEEPVSSPSSVNTSVQENSAQELNVQSTTTTSRVYTSPWPLRKKRRKCPPRVQVQPTVQLQPQTKLESELEIQIAPTPIITQELPEISNDDMAFFQSLGPIIRNFTMHQKLLFRSEVLNSAMSIVSAKHESHEC